MKIYDKNKELLYLKYWDVNNLYGWAMSQKLPVNNFESMEDTSKFNEDFIKNCNDGGDEGYFVEVDIQYPDKLHERHNDFPFLPERIKLEKVERFGANLHNKIEYVMHIKNLKQTLHHGLILKKVHRVIYTKL